MSEKREASPELPEHVIVFLRGLAADRFFGSVTITFQAGKAGTVRIEQVHKVEDLGSKEKR